MNSINELDLSRITKTHVFLIGDLAFLCGHLIYLTLFHIYGITIMERYNYFSVAFYFVMLFVIKNVKNISPFVLAAMLEFAVHVTLSLYCIGWDAGFAQFMLVIIPIPFYLNLKHTASPFIISGLDISYFIALRFVFIHMDGVYDVNDFTTTSVLFVINSLFGFFVIVYVSAIYIVSKERTQKEMQQKNESLNILATIDPLTQLFNRRAMIGFMKLISKNASESGKGYVIGLGDIDDFKRINDTYGHDAGDDVLKKISQTIAEIVPSEGYVCRWGGEEILFAIPSSQLEQGRETAERICKTINDLNFESGEKNYGVTVTFGVCQVTDKDNFDYEKGIKYADNRLYIGKQNGKNQAVSSD